MVTSEEQRGGFIYARSRTRTPFWWKRGESRVCLVIVNPDIHIFDGIPIGGRYFPESDLLINDPPLEYHKN